MKTIVKLSLVAAAVMMLFACEETTVKVDDQGLTRDIRDLIPSDILDAVEALGMPINGGNKPPTVDNTYLIAPMALKATNISNDFAIGYIFSDLTFKLYDQKNSDLTIMMDYNSANIYSNNMQSYIVGRNNLFTVFVDNQTTRGDEVTDMVMIISGKLVSNGLEDLHLAYVMVDNKGYSGYINNGECRIFIDQDGLAEIVASTKVSSNHTLFPGVSPR